MAKVMTEATLETMAGLTAEIIREAVLAETMEETTGTTVTGISWIGSMTKKNSKDDTTIILRILPIKICKNILDLFDQVEYLWNLNLKNSKGIIK